MRCAELSLFAPKSTAHNRLHSSLGLFMCRFCQSCGFPRRIRQCVGWLVFWVITQENRAHLRIVEVTDLRLCVRACDNCADQERDTIGPTWAALRLPAIKPAGKGVDGLERSRVGL